MTDPQAREADLADRVAFIAVALLCIPFRGWVFQCLWHWFLVPLGAPRIGVLSALGLLLLAGFARDRGWSSHATRTQAEYRRETGMLLVMPLLALVLGALLRVFIGVAP